MRFAVVSAAPSNDWHSRQIIHACAARGSVDVFAPTDFSLHIDQAQATLLADGMDVREWDVWLLPRPLGDGGDSDFQCEAYRILGEQVPVVNPVDALLRAEDKVITAWILARAGVPTPRCVAAQTERAALDAVAALGTAVAKPPYGSLGIGIEKLAAGDADAAARLRAFLVRHGVVCLQQFVASGRRARDLRLFVIGDEVAAAIARVAPAGEFRANVHQGGEAKRVHPDDEAVAIAVRATRALGLHVAGVDMLEKQRGYTVLEVNGIPRWEGILDATGADMAEGIVSYAATLAARKTAPGDGRFQHVQQ